MDGNAGGLAGAGGHSVTYEDPDAHIGHHRPLVMRHHNMEVSDRRFAFTNFDSEHSD